MLFVIGHQVNAVKNPRSEEVVANGSHMRTPIRYAACSVALWLVVGCAGDYQPTTRQEASDSLGVQLVRVSGPDTRLDWQFEERWRIGGEDEGPTAFAEFVAGGLATSPKGGVVALDRNSHRVVEISASGELIQVLGREGQGPGELAMPTSVAVLQDSSVWVYDISKRGVVRFTGTGESLPDLRIEGLSYSAVVRPGMGGVHMLQREPSTDSLRQFLITTGSMGEGDTLRVPALAPPHQVEVPGCNVTIPIPRIFAPRVLWDSWATRLAVSVGPAYAIGVHEEGTLVMSLRRDLEPIRVTESVAIGQYPEGFKIGLPGGSCTAEAAQMVRAQGYEAVMPSIANVRVAPSGEIWALRNQLDSDLGLIDIWSPSGDYLGTLPTGAKFPVAFLTDGGIVTIEKDKFDVPQLVAWNVQR